MHCEKPSHPQKRATTICCHNKILLDCNACATTDTGDDYYERTSSCRCDTTNPSDKNTPSLISSPPPSSHKRGTQPSVSRSKSDRTLGTATSRQSSSRRRRPTISGSQPTDSWQPQASISMSKEQSKSKSKSKSKESSRTRGNKTNTKYSSVRGDAVSAAQEQLLPRVQQWAPVQQCALVQQCLPVQQCPPEQQCSRVQQLFDFSQGPSCSCVEKGIFCKCDKKGKDVNAGDSGKEGKDVIEDNCGEGCGCKRCCERRDHHCPLHDHYNDGCRGCRGGYRRYRHHRHHRRRSRRRSSSSERYHRHEHQSRRRHEKQDHHSSRNRKKDSRGSDNSRSEERHSYYSRESGSVPPRRRDQNGNDRSSRPGKGDRLSEGGYSQSPPKGKFKWLGNFFKSKKKA